MSTPYQSQARGYNPEWPGVLPLPPKQKFPPPSGYTGASGKWTDLEQIKKWCGGKYQAGEHMYPPGNIALRLPRNVIGIDADMYGDKTGRETLAAAEEAWGALPPTWMSTSKSDGSGIRLYLVPEGLAWPESLTQHFGGGVELIRWDHRYVVCHPSIHDKTGAVYHWLTPEGGISDLLPLPEDMTPLPDKWVQGLTSGEAWRGREMAEMGEEEVNSWLEARPEGKEGKPCPNMRDTLAKYQRLVRTAADDGGMHDVVRDGVWALVGDAHDGHSGVVGALKKLRKVWLAQASQRRADGKKARPERLAKLEWGRILTNGVRKVAAEGEPESQCNCDMWEDPNPPKPKNGKGSALFDYKMDDIGNAERFARQHGENVRWCDPLGGWFSWDFEQRLWRQDTAQIRRWAIQTVRDLTEELKHLHDAPADVQKAFAAFIKSSGNSGKLNAMIEWAQAMKGIEVEPDLFDSDDRKLLASNGMVLLQDDGVAFRTPLREDYVTLRAAGEYQPGSWKGTFWQAFLDRFVPDLEVRRWLHKAVGYSLMGGNPQRLLLFVNGKTSSGKSTFGEAVRDALGKYAGPFNLNMFREQREPGAPNVQLVRMLPRRFILASEASQAIHLHADQLKRLTGAEALSGRLNRANELVERVPAFTPWIGTNGMPSVLGADRALRRRMRVIPFDETIAEADEDKRVSRWLKSPKGNTAVLSWAIEGWSLYAQEGLTDIPDAIVRATMRAHDELSDLNTWIASECEQAAEYWHPFADLFDNYQVWCGLNGIKPDGSNVFARQLGGLGFEADRRRSGDRSDDRKVNVRLGLRIRGRSGVKTGS